MKLVIAVTLGDPLGIGSEVFLKSLTQIKANKNIHYRVYGCEDVLKKIPQYKKLNQRGDVTWTFVPSSKTISKKQAGALAFEFLKLAVADIKNGLCDALVTAPISKEHVQLAGFQFPGHTEYLAHEFKVKDFAMMLYHQKLRVVLSTIHMPLKKVSSALTKHLIQSKLTLMQKALNTLFAIQKPHIVVCGLNPHAGENGLMGLEEKSVIAPAVKSFMRTKQGQSSLVEGPVSADMIFSKVIKGYGDAVLCQYHDQGLIAVKTTDWEHAINLTLGLPFVRTSPDHGTGFDIVGTGKASEKSMLMALKEAVRLTKNLKKDKS